MLSESNNEKDNEKTGPENTVQPDDEQSSDTAAAEDPGEETEISLSFLVFDIAGTIFLSIVILLLLMALFVRQVTVDGASMNNTLWDGDRLLVQCNNYTPCNGDIVIVTHGRELDEAIVKRVIATEGQHIDINYSTGEVVVDGVLLKEPYVTGPSRSTMNALEMPLTVPEGYVFVMGDNRGNSLDSRSERVGLIPVENIVGKAFFRWYPINTLGSLDR